MKNDLKARISKIWDNFFPEENVKNMEILDFIKRFPMLKLAEQSRIFFLIFRFGKFELEYFSENSMDILGISQEDFQKKNIDAFYEGLTEEHMSAFLQSVELTRTYYQALIEKQDIFENMTYRCGFNFNHSEKGVIKLLWRSQIFELDEDFRKPQRTLLMFQDITHLIKSDFFWFRAELKDNKTANYFTLRSDTEGVSKDDILSDREKEILKLYADGKTTEEIAALLFISKITVNNHRQNMLNKVGAKDLTALVQIAKITRLI